MSRTVETDNYLLDVQFEGDEESPVRFELTPGLAEHNRMPHLEAHKNFLAHELGCFVVCATAPGLFNSRLINSEKGIEDYSTYRTTEAEIELSIKMNQLQPEQIAIAGGHSGGNRQAMYKAATLEHIKGAVSIFGALTWIRDNNRQDRTVDWPKRGYKSFFVQSPGSSDLVEVVVPAAYTISAPSYDAIETVKGVKKPKLFIAGMEDNVALPSDIENGYEIAPEPKDLEWVDSNHFYLSKEKAGAQEAVESILKPIFGKDLARKKAQQAVPNYSDPANFDKVNELIADWMERYGLLPTQIGKRAISHS